MNKEYMVEGYNLMSAYIKENRIKTKNRDFVRRLDNFYNLHKDDEYLSDGDALKYINLEKEFYNNILPLPVDTGELALLEVLNILSQQEK